MAKTIKTAWLGARVEPKLFDQVQAYIEANDMYMGELVRNSVLAYMAQDERLPADRLDRLKGLHKAMQTVWTFTSPSVRLLEAIDNYYTGRNNA